MVLYLYTTLQAFNLVVQMLKGELFPLSKLVFPGYLSWTVYSPPSIEHCGINA